MPVLSPVSRRMLSVGAAATVLLGAVAAAPATAASSSVIKACADKKTGQLRLLEDGGKCRKGERKLKWNVSGPAGPTGATGAAGTNGTNGAAGATGARGPAGAFEAYDQTGTRIGTLAGWYVTMEPIVALASGVLVIWDVVPGNPATTNHGTTTIYYREAACAGTGYAMFGSGYPFDLALSPASPIVAGSALYHRKPGTPQSFTSVSKLTSAGCAAAAEAVADGYQVESAGTMPTATKPLYVRAVT